MKRDIRNLFKQEDQLKELPKNHRKEFLEKLKEQQPKKSNPHYFIRIVAILIIGISVGVTILYQKPKNQDKLPIVAQVEAIETSYLKEINNEWKNFLLIAKDEHLIERFRKKLAELNKDYQELSAQFKNDSNNILVVEALLENLQNRLQILKDIQSHIKLLNQKKSEQYENTI